MTKKQLFKALNGGSQPQSLYYTYSCMDKISQNVSVNIWICDEISKDPNEKCVTKKLCSEIKDGATKDICSSAQVSDSNKACVFDKGSMLSSAFLIDAGSSALNFSL